MATSREEYHLAILPKRSRLSLESIFSFIAGVASIVSLILSVFIDPSYYNLATSLFLIFIIVLLVLYIAKSHKHHRYAEALFYLHFINHIIRDALVKVTQDPSEENAKSTVQSLNQHIANALAHCFTLITRRKCRVSICKINPTSANNHLDFTVDIIARDAVSSKQLGNNHNSKGRIEDNTDFASILFAKNNTSHYLCNNLKHEYSIGKYKNFSFTRNGQPPEIIKKLGVFHCIKGWNLPYVATIVSPIRYTDGHHPPKEQRTEQQQINPKWQHYGFVCVDNNTKNTFNATYDPEILAATCDVLYGFYAQVEYMVTTNK